MTAETINQNELISEIEKLHDDFNKSLYQFSEEELNKVPFEGSWTAGQVAEHIIKSNGGILEQLLNGKTKNVDRPYDEQLEVVQEVFRSEEKMKSATVLEPGNSSHNLDSIISTLEKLKEQQIETVMSKNLNEVVTELKFPPSSDGLTRYEWLQLMIEHGNRHRKQIENIGRELN